MEKTEDFLKVLKKYVCFIWLTPLVGIVLIWWPWWPNEKNDKVITNFIGNLGPFGDFIAGTTVPLLTFVSFLAILKTLSLQKEQMLNQQEELNASIKEMREQGKTLEIQRFESTFFNMLNLHNEIVRMMQDSHTSKNQYGQQNFRIIYEFLVDVHKTKHDNLSGEEKTTDNERERISATYKDVFPDRSVELGQYFRNLHSIMRYIDETTSENINKDIYVEIIKAHLSSYEIALLFYNFIGKPILEEREIEFLKLLDNLGIIELMDYSLVIDKDLHIKIYEELKDSICRKGGQLPVRA
ncbi:putative phage abortive infection protein [Priestia megaterium]|uniref:putative phage abortive infection protein n=1 Tax=Priestia megaterium TaxID=1404 RepID=UPI00215B24F3|nr:putative phage abortive infection protein [Priestia megaterium]MCR8866889.1 putative phage abortive infection protein [Priestia megaterium]